MENIKTTQTMFENALADRGNTAKIKRVFEKAKRGEKITVGCIGGSITEGASATSADKQYASLLCEWFKKRFPKAEIELVNAGVGATGSVIATGRIDSMLLSKKPDFVLMEFAVNDQASEKTGLEAYESNIRRILKSENNPALILMFMCINTGDNRAAIQMPLGRHYSLPLISYRDAVWNEMQKNMFEWSDIAPDFVHPNDTGHQIAADIVTHFLESAYEDTSSETEIDLPKPIFQNRFENAKTYDNENLISVSNNGFEKLDNAYPHFKNGWKASGENSEIEFSIDCSVLSIVYKCLASVKGGSVKVTIDDGDEFLISSDFSGGFGDYPAYFQVVSDKEKKQRKIKIAYQNDGEFVLLHFISD